MKAINYVIYGVLLIIMVCVLVSVCVSASAKEYNHVTEYDATALTPQRNISETQTFDVAASETVKPDRDYTSSQAETVAQNKVKQVVSKDQKQHQWSPTKYEGDIKNEGLNISSSGNRTYLGKYYITGYDICIECCGKTDGITASGAIATVGRTVAMNGVPFGTRIYIEGIGERVVEDRGGMSSGVIDVLCSNHAECYAITGSYDVYIIN